MANFRIVLRDLEDHDEIHLPRINASVIKHLLWYKAHSRRETEDLIAMGTIWSPNAQTSVKQLNSSTSSTSSLTNNSITNVTGRNMHINTSQGPANSTGLPQANRGRSIAGMKPILVQTSKVSSMKDVEPRYIDPVIGAPASFQQRLMELSALEAETIRYERSKKVKKKFKQDRDS